MLLANYAFGHRGPMKSQSGREDGPTYIYGIHACYASSIQATSFTDMVDNFLAYLVCLGLEIRSFFLELLGCILSTAY